MRYLLDVNVLVAWGWADHVEHRRVSTWIAATIRHRGNRILTSPIPELGFIRVSIQRLGGRLPVGEASQVLAGMLRALGKSHDFLADDQSSATPFPDWCTGAPWSTDAHLKLLADHHDARLATLDTGIPGGYLIPLPPPI